MERIDFCKNWTYRRAGEQTAYAVTLPHDAMIHEVRDAKNASGSAGAYFAGGIYEYEKSFFVPESWKDKYVTFLFEGVYKNSEVFINGKSVGGCAYGYSQFNVEAGGALEFGVDNTIRVIARNDDQPNSRWYTGSGIYRPVWLLVSGKSHIDIDGVKITTLSYNPAKILVETGHTGGNEVRLEILDSDSVIAKTQGNSAELDIPGARLWSEEEPNLYSCRVTLLENGEVVDEISESFGIRFIEWSPQGLFINGNETLLRGCCVHHDNGILGACAYDEAEWRRVKMLKDAGYNAIRSSHNPCSRAMLNACDFYGVYMIDETWDVWYNHKSKYDYACDFADSWRGDIRAMVERDYNHPSVIMYSLGNEVSEPASKKGVELTREMVAYTKTMDTSRAVTIGLNLMIVAGAAKGKGIYNDEEGGRKNDSDNMVKGMNSTMFNLMASVLGTGMNNSANSSASDKATTPVLSEFDISGYNYTSGRYAKDGKLHPNRVIFGSETFPQDLAKNWAMVKKYPYLIGDFMWTGWDYLGEVGLGAWAYSGDGKGFNKPYPWLLAETGVLDILGNPNGELFWAQAVWGLLSEPKIAIQPVNHPKITPAKGTWRGTNAIHSWSWKGCEGNKAIVEVYFDCYKVELLLNGKSIGKKKPKGCRAVFRTKYAPGTLSAISYDIHGAEIGRCELISATGKSSVRIIPEEQVIAPGGIAYANLETVGENGICESNADRKLTLSVEGGKLLGFGSANPRTAESYTDGSFTTYYGRAQAVVRAGDATGEMKISASCEGKEIASAVIQVS